MIHDHDTHPFDFRLSRQRQVILQELRKVTSHPTADEVYVMVRKILPRISLGTVYRNLEFLVSRGHVLKVGVAGSQKRFDGNPRPHPHVRCRACGKVEDIPAPLPPPPLGSESVLGYRDLQVNLELVGVCPACCVPPNHLFA